MTLKEFFIQYGIRYSLWAKDHNIPASCLHRHLHNGGYFKPRLARRIHDATNGEVPMEVLCPEYIISGASPQGIQEDA